MGLTSDDVAQPASVVGVEQLGSSLRFSLANLEGRRVNFVEKFWVEGLRRGAKRATENSAPWAKPHESRVMDHATLLQGSTPCGSAWRVRCGGASSSALWLGLAALGYDFG
nr:hypothetical protein Iba_chr13fCG4490 [Ipomoea batatas]